MNDLIVDDHLRIPESELRVAFARSGGPGGQNVNKVETKVELRWHPAGSAALRVLREEDAGNLLARLRSRLNAEGELLVVSSRFRGQAANRRDAEEKLCAILRAARVRLPRRKKSRPSRGAVERRLKAKHLHARRKQDRQGSRDD